MLRTLYRHCILIDNALTKMKTINIILITLLLPLVSFEQAETKIGIDCNPKLNPEEIQFLKTILKADTFDFKNRNIGFATNGGFNIWGFDNSFLPISKKEYFKLIRNDTNLELKSKLVVLDSIQQQKTKGFEAIIFAFHKKYQAKAERSSFKRIITVFGYRGLNYPDNLNLVGNDNSPVLSEQDAVFFNQIFKQSRGVFGFNEKKIAIINTQARSILPKSEFIDKVKKHLEQDFLYPFDFLYILNDKEKKDSGGYDAVIIYDCLKCGGGDAVEILKKKGTL